MCKKLSAFLFVLFFSGGACAALPVTNSSNVNVNGAAVSSTNPLSTYLYGALNGTSTPTPLFIKAFGGTNYLEVYSYGINLQSVAAINSNTNGVITEQDNTQGTYQQASIAAAATVATLTPPANNALEGWAISITSNATLAVAGTDTITVALNGVTLYQTSVYIPATALSVAGQMYSHKAKYNAFVVPKVGSAGTFTVTLGTALATGTVNVNEYSSN